MSSTSPGLASRITHLSVSTCDFGTSLVKSRTYSSAGARDDLVRRTDLDDLAVAHDQDPVAELQRLGEVVGDEDHRLADLVVQPETSFCMSRRISGSSAENGSSNIRMSGSEANARARPTRCCMPPESWSGKLFS